MKTKRTKHNKECKLPANFPKQYLAEEPKLLGKGGNGSVWVGTSRNGKKVAVKMLNDDWKDIANKKAQRRRKRFLKEIDFLTTYKQTKGIISIINSNTEDLWYSMPLAEMAFDHKRYISLDIRARVKFLVQQFRSLAGALNKLHAKGISHRDIKPANILLLNGDFTLSDFGLVHLPDANEQITQEENVLGAIYTIAPEMRRKPGTSDGCKADVYSLAKTLWMFLTGDDKGFDGPYNTLNSSHGLRFKTCFRNQHLAEIEELLTRATDDSPSKRPTMKEVAEILHSWLVSDSNYRKAQEAEWKYLHHVIISNTTAETYIWRKREEIINILNLISASCLDSHVLFSEYGGEDFKEAEPYPNNGLIEIHYADATCEILKPRQLLYENFHGHQEFNYMILATQELQPLFTSTDDYTETLLELSPGNFTEPKDYNYGVYDYDEGTPLPKNCRLVERRLKGDLLFVFKYGIYNGTHIAYMGVHAQMPSDTFRQRIEELIDKSTRNAGYAKTRRKKLLDKQFDEMMQVLCTKSNVSLLGVSPEVITNHVFSLLPTKNDSSGKLSYAFLFKYDGFTTLEDHFSHDEALMDDGSIKPIVTAELTKAYKVDSPELARRVRDTLNKEVRDILRRSGAARSYPRVRFEIRPMMRENPCHLFTEDELFKQMRHADDRVYNLVVIDQDGYISIINDPQEAQLFPVIVFSSPGRNLYFGKYSSLQSVPHIYRLALQGWLYYLEHRQTPKSKYPYGALSNEELSERIREHYV